MDGIQADLDSQAGPEKITGTKSGNLRDTTSSLNADAIVWPDPSPLDSWWKRVVIDRATALAEGEPTTQHE